MNSNYLDAHILNNKLNGELCGNIVDICGEFSVIPVYSVYTPRYTQHMYEKYENFHIY